MKQKLVAICFPLALILIASASGYALSEWQEAALNAKRLSPEQFKELPKEIISDLKARNCTIPQVSFIPHVEVKGEVPHYHNVIRGEFIEAGQEDIAVLCSVNSVSSLLVYENGQPNKIHVLAKSEDVIWIQGMGENTYMFSRRIFPTNCQTINAYYERYKEFGAKKPPECLHDGIEELFESKGSVIHYYDNRKWIELGGSD